MPLNCLLLSAVVAFSKTQGAYRFLDRKRVQRLPGEGLRWERQYEQSRDGPQRRRRRRRTSQRTGDDSATAGEAARMTKPSGLLLSFSLFVKMLQQRMQQQQLFRQQQQQMGGVGGPGAGVGVRAGGMGKDEWLTASRAGTTLFTMQSIDRNRHYLTCSGMTRSPMAAGSPQQQQQQFQGGPQQYHQQQPQLMGNSGNTQGNSSGGNFHQQQMMRQQMMMGGNPQQQQQQDFLHHQQQQRQNVVTSLSSPQPSSQQMGQQVPQGPASGRTGIPDCKSPSSQAPEIILFSSHGRSNGVHLGPCIRGATSDLGQRFRRGHRSPRSNSFRARHAAH